MPLLCGKHNINYLSGRVNHHWNGDKIHQVVRMHTQAGTKEQLTPTLYLSYFSHQYSSQVQLKGPCLEKLWYGQTAHWHPNHQSQSSLLCLFSLSCNTNLQRTRQPFPPLCSHSHPQFPALLCQSLVFTPSPKTDYWKIQCPASCYKCYRNARTSEKIFMDNDICGWFVIIAAVLNLDRRSGLQGETQRKFP